MTPADKSTDLRALAVETRAKGLDLLALSWERLPDFDLGDPAECARWVAILRAQAKTRGDVEADIIARAADIIEGVTP